MTTQENIASAVATGIRADIISGELRPGSRLKVRELATRYHVSSIPVREALSRLATSGFVTAEHQRGFKVADASLEDLLDLTETRIHIECEALRQAVKEGGLAWEGELISAHHCLTRLQLVSNEGEGIDHEWAAAHAKFHAALLAGCRSRWLLLVAGTLREQTERYRNLSVLATDQTAPRDVGAEHEAIVKAALGRDAAKASELLAEHLRRTAKLAISLKSHS